MLVTGVAHPLGAPVAQFRIEHGAHPRGTLFELGFVPIRPLSASLHDGEIVFTWLVREAQPTDQRPAERHAVYLSDLRGQVRRHQRVAAYAVVTSSRGVLGTVNSSSTPAPGAWTLPGGGIDPGESPSEAVLRELHEETGQRVVIDRILSLESEHWIGRSKSGEPEDFHALRIIYAATCPEPTDPVVHDVGGSTQHAEWVDAHRWRAMHWTNSARTVLARFSPTTPHR